MNSKKVIADLSKLSKNTIELEKMIVYSYVKTSGIVCSKSILLKDYFCDVDSGLCENAYMCLSKHGFTIAIENLVELFEYLVTSEDRKENGIVYTPAVIRKYIIANSISFDRVPSILDPACGCGAFLMTAAEEIHNTYELSYRDIIANMIFGVDLDPEAIRKAKLLLELLACSNDEYEACRFNFVCGNMLDPSTSAKLRELNPTGFGCVVGNPPYVRYRNINEQSKCFLSKWNSSSIGNVDLYMPFFEAGISLLSKGGVLGFISPNSYIQSINGRKLRSYLINTNYGISIIDFRDTQIFKGVTSYTCITMVDTGVCTKRIKYVRLNEHETLDNHSYSEYDSTLFKGGTPWRMRERSIDTVIKKMESAGCALSNWKIRNGLATLKNDLYFFTPESEDDLYFYRTYKGKKYAIEKSICIKVAKPNIIKNEKDLSEKIEQAIFPYNKESGCSIIDESVFLMMYPSAYRFLSEYRDELDKRDKGKGKYPAWYAYGRTQGMNNFGKKLLIPYIAAEPVAVLSLDEDLLFYCGYAIISNNTEELELLKRLLESDAFWFYIYHTSKPYSKGYMAFAKNYLVNFTIPTMSKAEVRYLLSCTSKQEINAWIWEKYGIEPMPIMER